MLNVEAQQMLRIGRIQGQQHILVLTIQVHHLILIDQFKQKIPTTYQPSQRSENGIDMKLKKNIKTVMSLVLSHVVMVMILYIISMFFLDLIQKTIVGKIVEKI
jgi:hypothetical protein